MSERKSKISKKRAELWRQEKALLTEIENESHLIENKIEKVLKTSLVIGSGILIGYALYSGIAGSDKKGKKNKKDTVNIKPRLANSPKSFKNQILSEVVKKGLSMLVNSLSGDSSKNK